MRRHMGLRAYVKKKKYDTCDRFDSPHSRAIT
jgi:hypothetical protein